MGARILASLGSGEIAEADLAELRKALTKPSRGWVVVVDEVSVPVPEGAPPRTVKRQFLPSAVDLLPILDGLGA
jgi:hypothetical protein